MAVSEAADASEEEGGEDSFEDDSCCGCVKGDDGLHRKSPSKAA